MHPITGSAFYLSLLAFLPQLSSAKAVTTDVCITHRSTVSPRGPIPTNKCFTTVSVRRDATVTVAPRTTVTPRAATVRTTVTVTSTTTSNVPQKTDTLTNTFGTLVTSTLNIPTFTFTSTEIVEATVTTPAVGPTTVPTPAGFQPVQDTLPGSASLKRSPGAGSLLARGSSRQPLCPVPGKKPPPRTYPVSVDCYGTVKRFVYKTKTVKGHKTVTATARRPTKTVTTTRTSTSTILATVPDASTTVTVTTTDTSVITNAPTITSVATQTNTVTVPTYTATAYAVCSDRNIAGSVSGYGIDTAFSVNNQNFDTANTADATALDCCNSCAKNPLCVSSAFEPQFPAGQQCYLVVSTQATCASAEYTLAAVINNPPLPPSGGYFISNGNCGAFNQVSS